VLAVVNALGDVIRGDGSILAGARGADGSFLGSDALVGVNGDGKPPFPGTNTTLVAVGTDLPLGKPDLARLARMACTAFPRAISPVHTPFDGDLVFTLSSDPNVQKMDPGEILSMGILARDLTEEAIRRAVTGAARSVDPADGKPFGGPVGGS
jgi:L-aminopeptidase/D-esterase-like protein